MQQLYIHPDIAKANTLSTDYYTSPQYLESSKEKIFAPSWQFIGSTHMLSGKSTAVPFTLLEGYINEPLALTRNNDDTLHCISNVCTHRGNLLVPGACQLRHIRCKYHGRMFSLGGKFMSMPEFKEVENFPTEADDLHSLPVFTWGQLLFTSLQPSLKPEDYLGDMMQRMHWFPIEKLEYRADRSKDYIVKANWALYCENYLEGFHIPFVHAGLNEALDFCNYTTELFQYSNLQVGVGKNDEECFTIPPSSPDHGRNIAAYYFWVFPNMMFNFYPWGLSVNLVQPLGTSECKVSFLTYVSDESKLDMGAGDGLDTVELEDEEIVENVQKGIRSRFYTHGRYSVTREQGTHHFHTLIAKFMNS